MSNEATVSTTQVNVRFVLFYKCIIFFSVVFGLSFEFENLRWRRFGFEVDDNVYIEKQPKKYFLSGV